MSMSRRSLLVAVGAATPLLLAEPSSAQSPPDLSTPEGWLSWLPANRDRVGIALDDGRGAQLAHAASAPMPLASAVKVLHLAAYAEAVVGGRLDPAEQVRVGDWERYYLPTDGGAHKLSLEHLGVPADESGYYAADPDQRVALREMVAMMITYSDSAVPDLLRDRLGTREVLAAGRSRGWARPDVRSLCAEYLFLALPETAPPPGMPTEARRSWGFAVERRYRDDPALRQRVRERLLTRPLPPWQQQTAWASATAAGAPRELAAVHRALAGGTDPVSALAREHLEAPTAGHLPPGVDGIGFKGGSLPGVLACGLSVRRTDGAIGSGGLVLHDPASGPRELRSADPALPLLLALRDAAWRDRLAAALGR
ncbi:serine hydrolase [Saccharopolyspora griseoalba]|uniref:Beta-lactamase n=1 Tax=Saccharopolyspora griseoalba TaxID=1431848 RepID=A0ABW2LPB9_9PSEU